MSSRFHKLTVKEVDPTTSDCVVITLDVPDNLHTDFKFIQGQHIVLKAEVNGEPVQRSYSLCSAPYENEWKVAVKRIQDGKFSSFANTDLKAGDTLEVMVPDGRFYVPLQKEKQTNYIAFAAGSGITPILSIIKTHLKEEPHATFKLFYTNRNNNSVILKEELEAVKNTYLNRFEVYYFFTKQMRDVPIFNGRIDADKLETLSRVLFDTDMTDHYFLCGPEQMIFTIRDFLISKSVDPKKIHFELFNTSSEKKEKAIKAKTKIYEGKVSDITITEGGKTTQFKIPQGSDNILDAALNNAADLPFACKGGVCCTCRAKLLEGEVDVIVNYGLEPEEIKDGYILTCQAIPISEKLVVDFDA